DETDAIATHLGQTKLEKRQAELILQHGGREAIEAALEAHELPDQVQLRTLPSTRADDLRRWRVAPLNQATRIRSTSTSTLSLLSAICYLLSAICYLLSAICYLLSAICYLPPATSH